MSVIDTDVVYVTQHLPSNQLGVNFAGKVGGVLITAKTMALVLNGAALINTQFINTSNSLSITF